jgi:Ca-activated chloride channel family protein
MKIRTALAFAAALALALSCQPQGPGTEKSPQSGGVEKASDKPGDKPAEPATDKPADKPVDKPTEPATDKPADKPVDKPAEPATDKPADKPVDAPTEKPVEKEPVAGASDTKPASPAEDEKPAENVQLNFTRTAGSVTMEVIPNFTLLPADQGSDMNLLIKLQGAKSEAKKRPPLDLAIVLDRSGSMRGDKLRFVKQAAMELVDKLDRTDRVTLITYSTEVSVEAERLPMDAPGREQLRNIIAKINATDRTALGPALFTALDILEKAQREETDLAHVILLSDGLANVGETRPEILAARTAGGFSHGVSITTLGVGLDYNEDLMTRVADQGGGRYHFIKDADNVAGVLSDEQASLSSSVARGLFLSFRPANGVRLDKVFGYPVEDNDGMAKIKIGGLYSAQTREILVRLRVSDAKLPAAQLGTLFLTFKDITAEGKDVEEELPIGLAVSADADAVKKSEKTEVTIRVTEVQSADEMEQAARAVERGDFDSARGIMSSSIGRVRAQAAATPSARLESQVKALEAASGAAMDAAAESEEAKKDYIKGRKAESYNLMK